MLPVCVFLFFGVCSSGFTQSCVQIVSSAPYRQQEYLRNKEPVAVSQGIPLACTNYHSVCTEFSIHVRLVPSSNSKKNGFLRSGLKPVMIPWNQRWLSSSTFTERTIKLPQKHNDHFNTCSAGIVIMHLRPFASAFNAAENAQDNQICLCVNRVQVPKSDAWPCSLKSGSISQLPMTALLKQFGVMSICSLRSPKSTKYVSSIWSYTVPSSHFVGTLLDWSNS